MEKKNIQRSPHRYRQTGRESTAGENTSLPIAPALPSPRWNSWPAHCYLAGTPPQSCWGEAHFPLTRTQKYTYLLISLHFRFHPSQENATRQLHCDLWSSPRYFKNLDGPSKRGGGGKNRSTESCTLGGWFRLRFATSLFGYIYRMSYLLYYLFFQMWAVFDF